MMVEPVGTTLAVVGILQPTFHLCRTLYRSYKGVRLFGQDHVRLNREYDFQMARLNHVSEQKLEFMELKINPNNKDDVNAQSVKQKLDAIYEQMKRSKNILDSFDDAAKKDGTFIHYAMLDVANKIVKIGVISTNDPISPVSRISNGS